jgi:methyl-accepting chemotaxis protein-1 (serine sensor receptor)
MPLASARAAHQAVQKHLARFQATGPGGQGHVRGGQNQGPGLIDVEASYAPVALSILDLTARGEHDAAVAKLNAECVPLLARLDTAMDDYQALTEVRRRRSRTGR